MCGPPARYAVTGHLGLVPAPGGFETRRSVRSQLCSRWISTSLSSTKPGSSAGPGATPWSKPQRSLGSSPALLSRLTGQPRTTRTSSCACVDYELAESTTGLCGGNSNWCAAGVVPGQLPAPRGDRWFARFFSDDFVVQHPTGPE